MAKKIVWTETSLKDRVNIYRYWSDRNKSESYSVKLEMLFNEYAKLISQFPEVKKETDLPEVRIKIVNHFKLYYFNQEDSIQIIRIWDTRRNLIL